MLWKTIDRKLFSVTDEKVAEADAARSLLFTISNDIGQIACLYAMIHNLKKVHFRENV